MQINNINQKKNSVSLARIVFSSKGKLLYMEVAHILRAYIPLNYSLKSPNVMIARSLVMRVKVFIIQVSSTWEIAQGLKGLKVR